MPRIWKRAEGEPPLVLGHRGASALDPENSLRAFRRAAADGADGVELDALACATGEVVVFHDDDLRRLGGRAERIGELGLAALREVRLSSGETIPTLEEALDACGAGLLVNVEIKASRLVDRGLRPLVDRVAGAVEQAGAAGRVLVSSFNPLALRLWRRRLPAVPTGLLFDGRAPLPLRRAWALPLLRPFAVHPGETLCTPASVRGWHDAGYAVSAWTVDDPARLRALGAMGVDAIITNDPGKARAALRGCAASSGSRAAGPG